MKTLKRMLLINWHYFWNDMVDFEMINFLTGRNAAGKSTLIDALQLVLLGDTSSHYFNKAANEKSSRTLKGYLRGEIGDDGDVGFRYLRDGRFTSYIACEFYDDARSTAFTIGVVFDCYGDGTEEHRFFIIDDAIPEGRFISNKVPMPFKDLRIYLNKTFKKGKFQLPDGNRSYQDMLKGKLGGLKNKYFSLLKKAVSFTPITDIESFITEYVCDVKSPVDISLMQDNIRHYKRLEYDADMMGSRIKALENIAEKHRAFSEEKQRLEIQTYIIERAQHRMALDKLSELTAALAANEEEIAKLANEQAACGIELVESRKERDQLIADKLASDIYRKKGDLEKKQNETESSLNVIKEDLKKTINSMRRYGLVWRESLKSVKDMDRIFGEADSFDPLLMEEWRSVVNLTGQSLQYSESFVDANAELLSGLGANGFKTVRENMNFLKVNATGSIRSFEKAANEADVTIKKVKSEIEGLERGIKPYDKKLLDLKAEIENSLSSLEGKPVNIDILADLLEIRDSRWSNAIEAYLHTQKFYLIVKPQYFNAALKIYDRLKFERGFYDIGLVDTGKLEDRLMPPEKGSLAEEIVTDNVHARNFINYILGSVIKCDSVEELRNYDRAITDTCMLYQNYVARQLSPERWKSPYIGRKSMEEQIRSRKFELNRLNEIKKKCNEVVNLLDSISRMESINENEAESTLNVVLKASRIPQLETELREVVEKLGGLDLTWLFKLEEHIKEEERKIKELETKERELNNKGVRLETETKSIRDEKIPNEKYNVSVKKERIDSLFKQAWINENGEPRFLRELETRKSAQELYNNFYTQVPRTESQMKKKKDDLISARSEYNGGYKMSYDVNSEDNAAYEKEYAELAGVRLPQYVKQIQDAKEKAYEQFKDDFISKLKQNIDKVREQIDELNAALKMSSFGNDKYRFVHSPKQEYRKYYDMITDDLLLDGYNIGSHLFVEKHRDAIDELFRQIIDVDTEINSDARAELEKNIKRFTDYRTYLNFDLIVTDEADRNQRLSRTLQKKSGGETQTPFYISVLASFAQVYRIKQQNDSGNTIRLIIFDEAFSKMDSERIQESIRLLRRFGLQAILSAPPEKIGDIAPLVDRNLCVIRNGDASFVKAFDSRKLDEVNVNEL